MSEENIILATKMPHTVDTIYDDLRRLGIRNGDLVLVHSSLSSIGWVCGGPQTVIQALLKAIGLDGTLIMPAHSGDWSDPAEWAHPPVPGDWNQVIYDSLPAYEPAVTPSRGMGRIAELFRTYPKTVRSGHPQVSFCANGSFAKPIIKNHPLTPMFGQYSPLGKLYNLGAKVLLLGVGYGSCTSFHLAEALSEDMPVIRMGTAMMENGERVWKWFEDFNHNSDDFEEIGKAFEPTGPVKIGKVGNAESRLFDMKNGVNFAKEWLEKNRFGK